MKDLSQLVYKKLGVQIELQGIKKGEYSWVDDNGRVLAKKERSPARFLYRGTRLVTVRQASSLNITAQNPHLNKIQWEIQPSVVEPSIILHSSRREDT